MEQNDIMKEIGQIRSLMERSSKFLSISGLSGVLIGFYALIGASVAYYTVHSGDIRADYSGYDPEGSAAVYKLVLVAATVLAASLLTGLWMAYRKAKNAGQPIWNPASRSLLFAVGMPLLTGGLLTSILVARGDYSMVASSLLVFYGLSLCAGSTFTFREARWLGIFEIVLGLAALCLPGYGLWFWAVGFGVLHIIYGMIVYKRYE